MAKADKVEKFHSEASGEVYELLTNVVRKYHSDLDDTQFLILMKHGGWKSKGKTVFGKPKVLGDDLRRTLNKDVILYLNSDMWSVLSKPQRQYVLDHALFTLELKYDRHDDVKVAADGRPLLTTVPPDIEGFAGVIRRHGVIMEDVKRLATALTATNQLTFEDVESAAEQEQIEEQQPETAVLDPVTQAIEDEVYNEKNQVSIDDVPAAGEDSDDLED